MVLNKSIGTPRIYFQVDPQSTAYVRYTPSENNPHAEFADEIYFPTVLEQIEPSRDVVENGLEERIYDEPIHGIIRGMYNPEMVKRTWIPAMHRRSLAYNEYGDNNLQFIPYNPGFGEELEEENEEEEEVEELEKFMPFIEYLSNLKLTPEDIDFLLQPENSEQLQVLLSNFFDVYEEQNEKENLEELIREENLEFVKQKLLDDLSKDVTGTKFTRKYNTPEKFRNGWESRDEIPLLLGNTDADDLYKSRVYIDETEPEIQETGSGEDIHHPQEIFRELKQQHDLLQNIPPPQTPPQSGIFTEGGLVYVPESQISETTSKQDPELILKDDLGKFLDEFDWGFKRRERLDVKKPGPPFDEHILSTESNNEGKSNSKQRREKDFVPAVEKKDPRGVHPNPLHDQGHEQHYDVESDFVYIGLKDR